MTWTFYTKYGTSLEQGKIPARPAGTMVHFATAATPTGWLRCDGSVVLRATYPDLFAVIGTGYNTGGETGLQFRLPNLSNRFAVGAGSTFGSSGAQGGTTTHTHANVTYPAHPVSTGHTHTMPSHSHNFAAHEHTAGHTHGPNDLKLDLIGVGQKVDAKAFVDDGRFATYYSHDHNINADVGFTNVNTHSFTNSTASSSDAYSTNGTDGGIAQDATAGSVNNVITNHFPPYRALYVIIKT